MDRQRVGRIVGEAATLASARRVERDLPVLPHITPHSLRRTYISLALVANDFDVKWVMSQVGHADSKMTLDVYAQLEQRIPRHHGENLDKLLRGEPLSDRPNFELYGVVPGSSDLSAQQSYLQPPKQQTDIAILRDEEGHRRLFEGFLREYEAEGLA